VKAVAVRRHPCPKGFEMIDKSMSWLKLGSSYAAVALFISACSSDDPSPSDPGIPIEPDPYTAFANPELVTITGFNDHAMEPFVSRDGAYLFFNNFVPQKDLFYATFVDATTCEFQGAIDVLNTPAVEGAPSMDSANRFYYIGTSNYTPPLAYDTLNVGTWNGSTVTGAAPLTGLAIPTPGLLNFDIEVSPDGATIYFNDGDFSGGNGFPDRATIAIAHDSGGGFVRDPDSATIMADINTEQLEYAPCISNDGLEFFFTRLDLVTLETAIYRTTRARIGDPFAVPQLVSAISGFVEGPTLSPDERSLYYHKQDGATGQFQIYRVTRP
jgi:hypothetical protein